MLCARVKCNDNLSAIYTFLLYLKKQYIPIRHRPIHDGGVGVVRYCICIILYCVLKARHIYIYIYEREYRRRRWTCPLRTRRRRVARVVFFMCAVCAAVYYIII